LEGFKVFRVKVFRLGALVLTFVLLFSACNGGTRRTFTASAGQVFTVTTEHARPEGATP